jgi:hypothetical protein
MEKIQGGRRKMKDFIASNIVSIVLVLIFVCWVLYLVTTKQWDKLRGTGYYLIMKAERVITGTKKGKERFEYCIEQLLNMIPPWIRLFITESQIREQLQKWFNYVKDYLDDGVLNNSIE